MDFNSLIQLKRERLAQLEGEISDPLCSTIASAPGKSCVNAPA